MNARIVTIAAWMALCGLAGCRRDEPAASSATQRASGPNVLLITLDTTRADRLGCYGHEAAHTPALDGLAESGVRFEQAFCQVPLTLPSHVALLTGTYPPANGIRINAAGALAPEVPTLAEAFKRRGYRTAAFVAAYVLDASFGLDRGFDHYGDNVGGGRETWGPEAERRADAVADEALAWLDAHGAEPFFAWVHFFDPHHPYSPPAPYDSQLPDPYDGEIAFVDAQIQRLLTWLEAHELRERTLIVVAGDHGEAFGEHDEPQHGLFVYDTTLRVPLIMSYPAGLPSAAVYRQGVRLVDVLPTTLELVDIPAWPQLNGQSVLAAVRAGKGTFLPAYAESYYPQLSFGWAALRSLTVERWKYIAAPTPELYDRLADPGEMRNVFGEHPDVAARLAEALDALLASLERRSAAQVQLGAEALQRLQSLGYVGGSTTAADEDRTGLKDPKDMVTVLRGLMAAKQMQPQREYVRIVTLLEPLVARSPESDALYGLLGEAYLETGRPEQARVAYQNSLRTTPDDPVRLCGLGDALAGLGKPQDAELCYRRALEVYPRYGQAHSRMGLLYARQGRFELAEQHYRRDLELRPQSPNALSNLANVLLALRRSAEAADLLGRALGLDPRYAPAHENYWRALLWSGRDPQALTALRNAVQVLPRRADLASEMAWLLVTARDPRARKPLEALQLAEKASATMPQSARAHDVLAAATAATGDFERAVQEARRAMELAAAAGQSRLHDQIAQRLAGYESGRPVQGP